MRPLRLRMRTEPLFFTARFRTPPLVALALVVQRWTTFPEGSVLSSPLLLFSLWNSEYLGSFAICISQVTDSGGLHANNRRMNDTMIRLSPFSFSCCVHKY